MSKLALAHALFLALVAEQHRNHSAIATVDSEPAKAGEGERVGLGADSIHARHSECDAGPGA